MRSWTTPPPDLPAVELRGPAQVQGPLQQRPISLLLSQPYPLPLTGTLTLTVNSSSYSVDPAVQFSTGGRTVAFTIPANETQAQFPTGPEIYFQTGSIAGTINLRASFTTLGINVTPDAAPSLDVVIPPGPPQVLDVQLAAQSPTSLAVVVTGLATTRSLDQLELQFVSSPKFTVPGGASLWAFVDTGLAQHPGANSGDSVLTLYAADGVTIIERDDDDGSATGGGKIGRAHV